MQTNRLEAWVVESNANYSTLSRGQYQEMDFTFKYRKVQTISITTLKVLSLNIMDSAIGYGLESTFSPFQQNYRSAPLTVEKDSFSPCKIPLLVYQNFKRIL